MSDSFLGEEEDAAGSAAPEADAAPGAAPGAAPDAGAAPIPMMHNVKAPISASPPAGSPTAIYSTKGEGLLRTLCAAAAVPPPTRGASPHPPLGPPRSPPLRLLPLPSRRAHPECRPSRVFPAVALAKLLLHRWSADLDVVDPDPTDGSTLLHALAATAALPLASRSPMAPPPAADGSSLTVPPPASSGGLEYDPTAAREAAAAALQLVELVITAGAEVSAGSHKGNTPLHVACAASVRLPLIALLLRSRAEVNALNVRKEAPLHLLAVSPGLRAPTRAPTLSLALPSTLAGPNRDPPPTLPHPHPPSPQPTGELRLRGHGGSARSARGGSQARAARLPP